VSTLIHAGGVVIEDNLAPTAFSRSHALRGNVNPDALRRASLIGQDAERPGVRSHEERGNEKSIRGRPPKSMNALWRQ
jgi:hypothetical protein